MYDSLIVIKNKQMLGRGIDILIDDCVDNLVDGYYHKILFDYPWNRHGFESYESNIHALYQKYRCKNWNDIDKAISTIMETEIGMTTSCATNTIDKYAVFTNGMSVLSTPYRYFCQQKSVTSLTPVVSTSQNKGFTNVYHILSHIQGISDSSIERDYSVPTQTILLNNKKYLLSRFAFEIKE